jgi:cytochrome bd-type quinol oxidase subunit 2
MKYLVTIAFVGIIGSLAAALFFMMKSKDNGKTRAQKMAVALGLRVALSVLLFASVLLAWKLGYIQPTGIAAGR